MGLLPSARHPDDRPVIISAIPAGASQRRAPRGSWLAAASCSGADTMSCDMPWITNTLTADDGRRRHLREARCNGDPPLRTPRTCLRPESDVRDALPTRSPTAASPQRRRFATARQSCHHRESRETGRPTASANPASLARHRLAVTTCTDGDRLRRDRPTRRRLTTSTPLRCDFAGLLQSAGETVRPEAH